MCGVIRDTTVLVCTTLQSMTRKAYRRICCSLPSSSCCRRSTSSMILRSSSVKCERSGIGGSVGLRVDMICWSNSLVDGEPSKIAGCIVVVVVGIDLPSPILHFLSVSSSSFHTFRLIATYCLLFTMFPVPYHHNPTKQAHMYSVSITTTESLFTGISRKWLPVLRKPSISIPSAHAANCNYRYRAWPDWSYMLLRTWWCHYALDIQPTKAELCIITCTERYVEKISSSLRSANDESLIHSWFFFRVSKDA